MSAYVAVTARKFGSSITFMPKVSFRLFSEDEIVTRLRTAAGSDGDGSANPPLQSDERVGRFAPSPGRR